MSEKVMWNYLAEHVSFPMERLTDRVLEGLHDVLWMEPRTGVAGLLELKYLPQVRRPTKLFRSGQLPFVHGWWRRGGYSSVLVRSWDDWWSLYYAEGTPIEWCQTVGALLRPPSVRWSSFPGSSALLDALKAQPL